MIATNNVVGTSSAKLLNSAVHSADNVSTIATNSSTIDATLDADTISKQTSIGVTLAFNSVGVQNQNFLFNTVDALVGTDLVGIVQGAAPLSTVALIDNTTIDASGDLNVEAHGDQTINAEISNYVQTIRGGGTAVSVGAVIALNRVNSTVNATISNSSTVAADGDVVVDADNTADITATVVQPVVALQLNLFQGSQGTKSFAIGLVIARNVISANVEAKIDDVDDFDAGSVKVAADQAGSITSLAASASVSVAVGLSGNTASVGGGGAIANNSILGSAAATILDSSITAPTGTVEVHAGNSAQITSTVLAAALSVAGSFSGTSTGVAIGAALAFNYIGYTGSITDVGVATPLKTEASIRNSTVSGKKVKVEATSTAKIEGTILAAAVAIGASSGSASSSASPAPLPRTASRPTPRQWSMVATPSAALRPSPSVPTAWKSRRPAITTSTSPLPPAASRPRCRAAILSP